ncbi:MAG: hypothetical protein WC600_18595 [Desulfobaccales bacterium]
MIRPVKVLVKGQKYRSKTEGRWAIFFDALNIDFQYEPRYFKLLWSEPSPLSSYEDNTYKKYLPDFWIPLKTDENAGAGLWVEIKGSETSAEELIKLQLLTNKTGHYGYIFQGPPGSPKVYQTGRNGKCGLNPNGHEWAFDYFNTRVYVGNEGVSLEVNEAVRKANEYDFEQAE